MWWGQLEVDDYIFPGMEGKYLVNSQDFKSLSFLPPSAKKKKKTKPNQTKTKQKKKNQKMR